MEELLKQCSNIYCSIKPISEFYINKEDNLNPNKNLHNEERDINSPAPGYESNDADLNEVSETEITEEQVAASSEPNTDTEILELEKKRKTYWTEDTEKAVVEFLSNDCNFFQVRLEKYLEECKKKKIEVWVD